MKHHRRLLAAIATSAVLGGAAFALPGATAASGAATAKPSAPAIKTIKPVLTTPIKHVVVIFGENISFDHYFGTYPQATNTDGQPFTAKKKTPSVDGLSGTLLTANPNGANPKRYDPTNVNDVLTCDQDHGYTAEQSAFDGGLMDKFPASVGTGSGVSPTGQACAADDVMNYYDGNTVTGLWNYAQHFAMSDNSFGTTFGPSAPGAINLVSGDTGGVDTAHSVRGALPVPPATTSADVAADGTGGFSLIGDAQPYYDDCSSRDAVALTGTNIGDRLNAAGLSWGWFEGGFAPTTPVHRARNHRVDLRPADTSPGGPCAARPTTSVSRSAAPDSSVRRPTTSRITSRSSTTRRRRTRTTWRRSRCRSSARTRRRRASSTPPTTTTT